MTNPITHIKILEHEFITTAPTPDYHRIPVNLNKWAPGATNLYLEYRRQKDGTPIVGLEVAEMGTLRYRQLTKTQAGNEKDEKLIWTKIDTNLNKRTPNGKNYYLFYTTEGGGDPIRDILVRASTRSSELHAKDIYSVVRNGDDINKGASAKIVRLFYSTLIDDDIEHDNISKNIQEVRPVIDGATLEQDVASKEYEIYRQQVSNNYIVRLFYQIELDRTFKTIHANTPETVTEKIETTNELTTARKIIRQIKSTTTFDLSAIKSYLGATLENELTLSEENSRTELSKEVRSETREYKLPAVDYKRLQKTWHYTLFMKTQQIGTVSGGSGIGEESSTWISQTSLVTHSRIN